MVDYRAQRGLHRNLNEKQSTDSRLYRGGSTSGWLPAAGLVPHSGCPRPAVSLAVIF
ncbi:hypothetical protein BN1263200169 [Stenotrophomonas maltophilia]|nr:hypothetical protein BN1263200169 [Stenotrophomonas maltophilia]